ncbi:cell division protein MraZ [Neisseria gonorrhoeae]|nr:cell division protein MraZ [Neisseria gonorrhoeae]
MFGGAHELSIDSKGRLAVPAKFRDILSRLYTPAVVATLESKHKLLMCCGVGKGCGATFKLKSGG